MRVTKLINNYVTEAVNKGYASRIQEEKSKAEAVSIQVNEKIAVIMANAEMEIQTLLEKDHPDFKTSRWNNLTILSANTVYKDGLSENSAGNTASRALMKERDEKIKDILINLELGATKADLDGMLKNL